MVFNGLPIFVTVALGAVLLWVSWVDILSYRLPDIGVLPLIPLGLAVSYLRLETWPVEAALGAVVGFAVLYGVGELYFRVRGVDGLGIGDAKLLAAAGAWLGAAALPAVVLLAALPALGVAILTGTRRLAFGPYLSAAFFALWLWSGR